MPSRVPIPTVLIAATLALGASLAGAYLLLGGASARQPMPATQIAPPAHANDALDAGARVEANIALLDARYAAEPVDRLWATRHEAHVRDFFATHRLAAQGLAGPASLETSCHSETCRVSVRYLDPLAAELATQQLAMHVAPRLPYAAVLPRALGDGSIQVEAWYSSSRATL